MSAGLPADQSVGTRRGTPVLEPGYTYGSVTEKISAIVLTRPTTRGWWLGFGVSFLMVMMLFYTISYLIAVGVGIWGINIPVGWGFAIVNFVWWIGLGHVGRAAGVRLLYVPVPQHDGHLAAITQPARLGRLRRLHLLHGVFDVLVCRSDPGLCHAARPRNIARQAKNVRHAGDGLVRLGPTLAPLSVGVFAARRSGDTAGGFGAHRRQPGLRSGDRSRLAHHDFSALLCCRRHLFRICDGSDAGDSAARDLQVGGFHHHAPFGEYGQGDAGHRPDRRVRLHRGIFHGLVWREYLRNFPFAQSPGRSVPPFLLGCHRLQHHSPALSVVSQGAHERIGIVRDVHHREYRHVARAIRHRGCQFASRLHALGVGDVQPQDLGLDHVRRNDRPVLGVIVPFPAVPAGHFHYRDA